MTHPKMVPSAVPGAAREFIQSLIPEAASDLPVALVGRRGYYRDTMGAPGVQERGIYDDAMWIVTPTAFVSFNANCDPSRHRAGIANLKAGVYQYQPGIHGITKPPERRYPAFIQAAPVTVVRDGGKEETGWFGINIHRGSYNSTSSEGCPTIYPDQWEAFRALLREELKRYGQGTFPFILTERADAR